MSCFLTRVTYLKVFGSVGGRLPPEVVAAVRDSREVELFTPHQMFFKLVHQQSKQEMIFERGLYIAAGSKYKFELVSMIKVALSLYPGNSSRIGAYFYFLNAYFLTKSYV